ncbi:ethanolamine ammonia-lyase reactivating factor EutA [Velocimicrobium porci]|uniref:Ethanolamine ammonia-lyase reactivating factor EutA n=1 Tax=Velocimicrobium porci TaxID=2606634 RepID=A0A6L5Y3L8_9FIRM|nr:ethanolamine ammonia-lyase reactivating factor EutA [Velocimicrobium porci]MSS64958.1 ethanolamine ammonia-lyase reactivating factor EutA [Velocimicrobium porci]
MRETILSVGIDIGTSTTQLIFSRLTIENLASSYTVPRISIVNKEVIYRSNIYFTPLRSATEIDAEAIKQIVRTEYEKADIHAEELKTGAVIITGETARKENANQVLASLSDLAGDFVVATAGPDLESVLSAKGAGADRMSEENRNIVANIDIGGGTSNIACYQKGKLKGVSCLDIGGRLIKIKDKTIIYIYPKIKELAKEHGIFLEVGEQADQKKLKEVCRLMADQLAMALHLKEKDEFHSKLYTNDGKAIPDSLAIDAVTFSGGVADYVYNKEVEDVFRYGDIGILLGQVVTEQKEFQEIPWYEAVETIRATVVGAGTHTTNVSGSTITYARDQLPIKNIPILRISKEEEQDLEQLTASIKEQIPIFEVDGRLEQVAISLSGDYHTSFADIQLLAAAIVKGADVIIKSSYPLVIVVENDIGKVLGNAIQVLLERRKDVICIDGIHSQGGDYIDIGEPVANGRVVPVVTKTLIFNS